jgi:hypothetical protein
LLEPDALHGISPSGLLNPFWDGRPCFGQY